jgi:isochorismate hydrolase
MKRKYFRHDNIDKAALDMLQFASQARVRKTPLKLPNNSALLVLDMQDYFLSPSSHAFVPSGPVIIPNIKWLVRSYSQNGKPVIFTRHLVEGLDHGGQPIVQTIR